MGYKTIGCIRQLWYTVKYSVHSWLEWQDAKRWANVYHPAWVEIVARTKNEEVREYYKNMILSAYIGDVEDLEDG